MDLTSPVDVAIPLNLMGSEACAGVRVMKNEAEDICDPIRLPIDVNSSAERCSTSIEEKDAGSNSAFESSLWRRSLHSHNVLLGNFANNKENLDKPRSSELSNGHRPIAERESAESQRKAGKMSRNGSRPSKRAKLAFSEDPVSSARDNDSKDVSGKGLTHPDKIQTVKHRASLGSKRGDKRYSKIPIRTMPNFSSASGENAFFGVYGLKPEISDVTKLVDDLSLNDLLEGSFACSSLSKERGEKVHNPNEAFLNLFRKACSVLPAPRSILSQNSAEPDGSISNALGSPSSVSLAVRSENIDNGNIFEAYSSPSHKEHSIKAEIPIDLFSFPLFNAVDVVERLSLPPPRDLESLLQVATKPSQYIRNNSDPRLGKLSPRCGGLPPFPWSHTYNGNSRTNAEAAKFITCRMMCHGRWVKLGLADSLSSPKNVNDGFSNLESVAFNQKLVASRQKQTAAGSGGAPCCQCASLFVSTVDEASHFPLERPIQPDDEKYDTKHCPLLLAAAETLCDIATQFPKQNLNGFLKWTKKLSQKSMKVRKSRSLKKPEETCKGQERKDSADQIKLSKRAKFSLGDNKKGVPSMLRTEITAEGSHCSANNKIKQRWNMSSSPTRSSEKLQLGSRK